MLCVHAINIKALRDDIHTQTTSDNAPETNTRADIRWLLCLNNEFVFICRLKRITSNVLQWILRVNVNNVDCFNEVIKKISFSL